MLCWFNSNGEPEKPLVIHVGRIGVEKSLELLKRLDFLCSFTLDSLLLLGGGGSDSVSKNWM